MAGIGYTGDSVYSAVKDTFADGVHMLVKIEYNSTSISVLNNGELALQRTVNYGVDSAQDTLNGIAAA